jgi:hypothetical protein
MERSKSTATAEPRADGKIRWKKEGRGVFRLKNHIYRPGEIFWAHPSEISLQFRDLIKPVDGLPVEVTSATMPVREELVIKPAHTKKQRESSSFWDIFDGEGKQVNEKALREEQADDYLESLTK